jgi:hypothetical protein
MFDKIVNWFNRPKKENPVNIYRITLTTKLEFNTIFDLENHVVLELTKVWEVSEAKSSLYHYFGHSFTQEQAEDNLLSYYMWPINVNQRSITVKEPNNRYFIERSSIYSWKIWETKKVELIGNHIELGYDKNHEKMVSE